MLSTAQQVWLRKLGGAKPAVAENASGIISAGRAKRSGAQSERTGERWVLISIFFLLLLFQYVLHANYNYLWNRFKQLKDEEKKQKTSALPAEAIQASASADFESEDDSENDTEPKVKF